MLSDARRIVVKIGTRILVQSSGRPETRRMRALVKELAWLNCDGREVAVVSSGAVGAGMEALQMKTKPTNLPDLQMAAAVGQSRLMAKYDALFSKERCKIGQVLLTHEDFKHKIRLTNARRTMENLIRNDVIPIINENDVVADEEMRALVNKLGDNDLLASLVVKLVRADLLILLTTVDGVRKPAQSGRCQRIRYLESIPRSLLALTRGKGSPLSTGGMETKLRCANEAAKAGCSVIIADGRKPGIIKRIMSSEDVGTLIVPSV